jgi:hypothetical protein
LDDFFGLFLHKREFLRFLDVDLGAAFFIAEHYQGLSACQLRGGAPNRFQGGEIHRRLGGKGWCEGALREEVLLSLALEVLGSFVEGGFPSLLILLHSIVKGLEVPLLLLDGLLVYRGGDLLHQHCWFWWR